MKKLSVALLLALLCASGARAAEIWVCGDLERVHPVGGRIMHRAWDTFSEDAAYRKANYFWDSSSRTVRLEGARGEVLGFQVILDRQGQNLSGVHVSLGDLEGPALIPARGNHRVFRTYYVKGAYPEVLVPLDKAAGWDNFSVPDKARLGFENNNQAVWVDLFIPPGTPPGEYRGALSVTADQFSRPKTLKVRLTVWNITLPEKVSYDVELNNYGSLWDNFAWAGSYEPFNNKFDRAGFLKGITGPQKDEFLRFERNAYKVCQNDRVSLNQLLCFQNGALSTLAPETVLPVLTGSGDSLRVADWSAYDRRWGPLFDGTAFGDCFRKGVPLAHHYLPFGYNTPSDFKNFVCDPTIPPYWGKNPVYEAENLAFARQFEEHANRKGWTRTLFQVYYNEKANDQKNPLIWHLDEPIDTTIGKEYGSQAWITFTYNGETRKVLRGSFDYDALKYYSRIMHTGFANTLHPGDKLGDPAARAAFPDPDAAKFVFRIDIGSQNLVRIGQGVLDGYIDQWMCGMYTVLDLCRKRVDLGEIYSSYRYWDATPELNNCFDTITAWNNYLNGSTGHTIWLTDGLWDDLRASWWEGTDATTLMYPGSTVGLDEPCLSYRVKSLRRGAQDYEYLLLLKALQPGREMEVLKSFMSGRDLEPAKEFALGNISPEVLYAARRELAGAILKAAGGN
jgi:hypothetical protein